MRHGLSSDWHTLTFGRKLANRQKKFRWAPLPDSVYMMELISFSEFVLVTCACTYQPLWSCPTLCHPMDFSLPGSPWDSRGRNTGVDCHALPQGIFLTQGSNLHLLHYRQILFPLSHHGSPLFT